jgi:hypothetical protein
MIGRSISHYSNRIAVVRVKLNENKSGLRSPLFHASQAKSDFDLFLNHSKYCPRQNAERRIAKETFPQSHNLVALRPRIVVQPAIPRFQWNPHTKSHVLNCCDGGGGGRLRAMPENRRFRIGRGRGIEASWVISGHISLAFSGN